MGVAGDGEKAVRAAIASAPQLAGPRLDIPEQDKAGIGKMIRPAGGWTRANFGHRRHSPAKSIDLLSKDQDFGLGFALDLKSEASNPRISLGRSVIRPRGYVVRSLRPAESSFPYTHQESGS
jgi:hypothetical protein